MRVTKSNEISFLNSGQCSVCAGHNVTVCACVHACVCVCVCERETDRQTEGERGQVDLQSITCVLRTDSYRNAYTESGGYISSWNFSVPSTAQGHLKKSNTFNILYHFKTQVTKSQGCLIHCYNVKNKRPFINAQQHTSYWYLSIFRRHSPREPV